MQFHCQNVRSGSTFNRSNAAGNRSCVLWSSHRPVRVILSKQLPSRAVGVMQQQSDIDDAAVRVDVARTARALNSIAADRRRHAWRNVAISLARLQRALDPLAVKIVRMGKRPHRDFGSESAACMASAPSRAGRFLLPDNRRRDVRRIRRDRSAVFASVCVPTWTISPASPTLDQQRLDGSIRKRCRHCEDQSGPCTR